MKTLNEKAAELRERLHSVAKMAERHNLVDFTPVKLGGGVDWIEAMGNGRLRPDFPVCVTVVALVEKLLSEAAKDVWARASAANFEKHKDAIKELGFTPVPAHYWEQDSDTVIAISLEEDDGAGDLYGSPKFNPKLEAYAKSIGCYCDFYNAGLAVLVANNDADHRRLVEMAASA